MKRLVLGVLALGMLIGFSGCANKVHNYSVSTENILNLKTVPKDTKVNIGKFTDSGKDERSVTCRLATPTGTPSGETFASYIQDSLTKEMLVSDLIDPKDTTIITANLDDIYGSTTMGNAYWEFKITMKSSNGTNYNVHTVYDYESSFSAASACSEMQRSFVPAVQKLNGDIIKHSKFSELVK